MVPGGRSASVLPGLILIFWNSQRLSMVKIKPPTVNLSAIGACDGEKNPSRQPAITSMGMVPEMSRVASIPPCAKDSFQRNAPGKSMAWPMRKPAAPEMIMAGSSSEP